MNRIVRRIIMCMLLIAALAVNWNPARWALIYALRLATFSAHLAKVMLQAFQALLDGFLRGRELAFDGDQEIRPLIKKAIPPTSKATPKLSILQTLKRT